MSSQGKLSVNGSETAVIEIDAAFARNLGLAEGQKVSLSTYFPIPIELAELVAKVGLLLHLNPPLAHTINIEPLTPADWESKVAIVLYMSMALISRQSLSFMQIFWS